MKVDDHLIHLKRGCAVVGDDAVIGAASSRTDADTLRQQNEISIRIHDLRPELNRRFDDLCVAVFKGWQLREDDRLVFIPNHVNGTVVDGSQNTARGGIRSAKGIKCVRFLSETDS